MKKHYRHENDCLNCGSILEGRFCHNCGQENLQIKESFGHMMNHAISDYFHFDEQFFKTLKPLLFKPGFLTNEYMAGRRAQYLHPVKMYIFISVVYFLLLFKSGAEPVKAEKDDQGKPATTQKIVDPVNKAIAKDPRSSANQKKILQQQTKTFGVGGFKGTYNYSNAPSNGAHATVHGLHPTTSDTSYSQYLLSQQKLPVAKRDGLFTRVFNRKVFSYNKKYGSRSGEVFVEEVQHNIPKMMFLILPLFALILKVTFSKNHKFYVEHLIYAFHLHCFLFIFLAIIMLLEMVIPNSWKIEDYLNGLSTIFILWYIYRSLRVVYNRSRFRTITKICGMSVMYFMVFMFCLSFVFFVTALFA